MGFRGPDARDEATWVPGNGGEWCCWFASQSHCIHSVAQGSRAIAIFNILGTPGDAGAVAPNGTAAAEQVACKMKLPGLAEEVAVAPLQRGSRVKIHWLKQELDLNGCEAVCSRPHGTHWVVELEGGGCRQLMPENLELLEKGEQLESRRLGFLLHHQCNVSGHDPVSVHHLRGRDQILYQVASKLGFKASIVTCFVVCEQDREEGRIGVRIAHHVSKHKNLDRDLARQAARAISLSQRGRQVIGTHARSTLFCIDRPHEIVGAFREQIAEALGTIKQRILLLDSGQHLEDDDFIGNLDSVKVQIQVEQPEEEAQALEWPSLEADRFVYWPFRGVVWLSSSAYIQKHFNPTARHVALRDSYEGTDAPVSVNAYRHAALLVEVCTAHRESTAFAQDLKFWDGQSV